MGVTGLSRSGSPLSISRPGVALVAVLATLCTITALTQTMVVPVLSKMSDDLDSSTQAVGWVVTLNLLAAATMTPLLSKLGDLRGRRRVLLGAVISIAAGSLLAACTSSLPALLAARMAQGASFCLFPLAVGILRDNLDPRRLPLAMSYLTGAVSVGAGLGLVVTGVLTHGDRDYRNIFWFTLALSASLLVAALIVVPKDRSTPGGTIDWFGAIWLGVALVLLLLPLTQGNDWGWTSPWTLGCLAGSVVAFSIWTAVETRATTPLVPVAMLRHPTLAATNVIGLFIGFGMFLIFLALSALVQVPDDHPHGFSASVLETSLIYLLPAAAIGVIVSPLGGAAVTRFGGRATLLGGSVFGLFGYGQLFAFHAEPWQVVVGGLVTNAAFSIGFAAVPAVIVSVVNPRDTAVANAMASIARTAGSALSSALVVALVAGRLMADGHPDETTFQIIFAIGAATMVVCIAAVLIGIPRGHATPAR